MAISCLRSDRRRCDRQPGGHVSRHRELAFSATLASLVGPLNASAGIRSSSPAPLDPLADVPAARRQPCQASAVPSRRRASRHLGLQRTVKCRSKRSCEARVTETWQPAAARTAAARATAGALDVVGTCVNQAGSVSSAPGRAKQVLGACSPATTSCPRRCTIFSIGLAWPRPGAAFTRVRRPRPPLIAREQATLLPVLVVPEAGCRTVRPFLLR
jgi:hypothetical protein